MLLDFWPDLQSAVFTARQVAVADWAVAMVDRVEVVLLTRWRWWRRTWWLWCDGSVLPKT